MKKREWMIVLCILVISFICGYYLNEFLGVNQGNSGLEAGALLFDTGKFNETVDAIETDFVVEDYIQILHDFNSITGVPDILDGRQDIENGLYMRTKMLIYKNPLNKNMIILNISAGKTGDDSSYWISSFGYSPDKYNSNEGIFAESYDNEYSSSYLQQYSFSHSGVVFHVSSLTDNNGDDDILSLSEVAKFSEQLILFLEDN